MRKFLLIIVITGLTSILIPIATCDNTTLIDSEIDLKWSKAFGQAVLDWAAKPSTNAIKIEVDWSLASWGLGAEIILEEPINLKEVAKIEALVQTKNSSLTKVYIMVSTPDDANLSFPARLAYSVTSTSSKFTFPVDKLVSYKPEISSKNFGPDDWKKVDRIKFILTKPLLYERDRESITISNPRIIYHKTIDLETTLEEPVQNEVIIPAKTTKSPDVESHFQEPNKTENSEITKEQKITHYQSLEELMNQYPPKDSDRIEAKIANNTTQKLIFDKIGIYKDGVQDWGTMDNENKFFFDVNWEKDKSGFVMNFHTEDSIEASGEWHLIFTAQALDRSDPQISVTAYHEDESDLQKPLHDSVTLEDRWKTFHIPLIHITTEKNSIAGVTNDRINRIDVMFLGTDSSLIKEDVIIVKDVRLVKKRRSNRIESFLEPAF